MMLFSELSFWFFFFVVFSVYWFMKSEKSRQLFLLAASYFFYGYWDWRFLALILFVTLVSYYASVFMEGIKDKQAQKKILMGTVSIHLIVLCLFKYFNFFTESFLYIANKAGVEVSFTTLNIVLPVGISFYIFQAISYVVDLYRSDIKGKVSLNDLAFYIAFFPQLVAGPIVRAANFLPQIKKTKKLERHVIFSSLRLITLGLIYKVILADNIAPFVDSVYADVSDHSDLMLVAGTLGFHSQIYFDFAGYTSIAIGVARLLGYRIPMNFNYPYIASSVTEFWHRWHISLSTWLRDYLFIPLGGSRAGRLNYYRNLMLTMLLGGLWHGAAWTFVIWGGIHGLALCVHKAWSSWLKNSGERLNSVFILKALRSKAAGFFLTQLVVLICWVFFRAESLDDAVKVVKAFLNILTFSASYAGASLPVVLIFLPLAIDHLFGATKYGAKFVMIKSPIVAGVLIGVGIALAISVLPVESQDFVYFQF